MGKKARMKKHRKIAKNINEKWDFAEQKLESLDISLTPLDFFNFYDFLVSIERPQNMTDDEYHTFLDKKASAFLASYRVFPFFMNNLM